MSIPKGVKADLQKQLWEIADGLHWGQLSASEKAKCYTNWTADDAIGGVLGRYIDRGRVRVYLKDTLMKPYSLKILAGDVRVRAALNLGALGAVEQYRKPHGLRLGDGRVVCWGKTEDWKLILMAVYERAAILNIASPYGAVLFGTAGRFDDSAQRKVVEDAGTRLGIRHIKWLAV
jgi:hypothetical protein